MAIIYYAGDRLVGLSTDIKPLDIADGATFAETDTLDNYIKVEGAWEQYAGGNPNGGIISMATVNYLANLVGQFINLTIGSSSAPLMNLPSSILEPINLFSKTFFYAGQSTLKDLSYAVKDATGAYLTGVISPAWLRMSLHFEGTGAVTSDSSPIYNSSSDSTGKLVVTGRGLGTPATNFVGGVASASSSAPASSPDAAFDLDTDTFWGSDVVNALPTADGEASSSTGEADNAFDGAESTYCELGIPYTKIYCTKYSTWHTTDLGAGNEKIIRNFAARCTYAGGTVTLQGSNNGSDWTPIWSGGVHGGANVGRYQYFQIAPTIPFRFLRCNNTVSTSYSTITYIYLYHSIIDYNQFLKFDLGVGQSLTATTYTLKSRDTATTPKSWTLQGSNNDADWDDLDTVVDYTGSFPYINPFTNVIAYRYYRILVTKAVEGTNYDLNIASIDAFTMGNVSTVTPYIASNPQNIKYDLGVGNELVSTRYSLNTSVFHPSDWTFEGSNNDADWDVLDTVSNYSPLTIVPNYGNLIVTTDPKFGAGCANLQNKGGQHVPLTYNPSLGIGDWTIDCWIKPTTTDDGDALLNCLPYSGKGVGYAIRWGSAGELVFTMERDGGYSGSNNLVTIGSSFVPQSVWSHCAIVRSGNTLQWYINGVASGASVSCTGITFNVDETNNNYSGLYLASSQAFQSNNFDGYLDEFRISDTARWTSGFTPPTSAYTADANTKLLLHLDTDWTDSSGISYAGSFPITRTFVNTTPYRYYKLSVTGSVGTNDVVRVTEISSDVIPVAVTYDAGVKKFGTSSAKFTYSYLNGNAPESMEHLQLLDNDWRFSGFFYFTEGYPEPQTLFSIKGRMIEIQKITTGLRVKYSLDGATFIDVDSDVVALADNTWYWISIGRTGNTLSFYVDGVAKGTADLTGITFFQTTQNEFHIGAGHDYDNCLVGRADEVELFVGIEPPHIVPTSARSTAYIPTVSWQSDSAYVPTIVDNVYCAVFIDEEEFSSYGNPVINTDLKFLISLDDGSTWDEITLVKTGDLSTATVMYEGSSDATLLNNTNQLVYKFTNSEGKVIKVDGVIIYWV